MKVELLVVVEVPDGTMKNEFHALSKQGLKWDVAECLQVQLPEMLVPWGTPPPRIVVTVDWLNREGGA